MNISCPLRSAATALPEAPALLTPDHSLSYWELDRRVTGTAARLQAEGFRGGERVALYLNPHEHYLVLLLALLRAGCVACPMSTRLPPAQLPPLLLRLGSQRLITERPLSIDKTSCYPPADLIEKRPPPSTPFLFPSDQPVTAVFTSGSTSTPKAALHSFGNHYFNALGSHANIPLKPGDRWLLSLPLYHVGGLAILFRCLLAGATVVLPDPAEAPSEALPRLKVTHASLVSTQLRRLLEADPTPPPSLQAMLLGGGPPPGALLKEAHAHNWPLFTTYGLTEMSSQVATTRPGASWEELQTAGQVLPHRRILVADDGEILVQGRTLFLGYLDGDALHRPTDEHGWFHTRDAGQLDADDYLHVQGRKDHLFISGGENIQPEEIEEALCRLKGIEQAVVVPVSDEEYGQRPVAFVRAAGETLTSELGERLAPHLPRFKVPAAFYPWPDEAPSTRLKLDRELFRRRAERLLGERENGGKGE